MVMLRSSSFLKRTVCTPEMAFTTVDLPCATWPIVPMLMVAWREITSGDSVVSFVISYEESSKTVIRKEGCNHDGSVCAVITSPNRADPLLLYELNTNTLMIAV